MGAFFTVNALGSVIVREGRWTDTIIIFLVIDEIGRTSYTLFGFFIPNCRRLTSNALIVLEVRSAIRTDTFLTIPHESCWADG